MLDSSDIKKFEQLQNDYNKVVSFISSHYAAALGAEMVKKILKDYEVFNDDEKT